MKILSVALDNVGVHDDRVMNVQNKGALVVTGPNGSGKSSFVEGVALALWGESLRGEPLWREGVGGSVTVQLDIGGKTLLVTRKRNKAGAKSLTWYWVGGEPTKWETPTKAQEALERIIGTFDTWSRTCVLSSVDSAHFSLATDSERKRLLERLLGIDRLDAAANTARLDLRSAEQRVALAQSEAANATSHVVAATTRMQQAVDGLKALNDSAATAKSATPEEIAKEVKRLKLAQLEQTEARAEMDAMTRIAAEAQAELSQAERRARLAAQSACPTCEQDIPETLKQELLGEVERLREESKKACDTANKRQEFIREQLKELSEEIQQVGGFINSMETLNRVRASNAGLHKTLKKQHADAEKALRDAKELAEKVEVALGELKTKVQLHKVVSEVLGLKGVRAHLLDTALVRVEKVANKHLRVLSVGMAVELRSTTEKKTGGTSDAISLRVSVKGSSVRPYASLSGGERRRVDVALLLALAEVAGAAAGTTGSTLWMDEVFDALDASGASAVGSLIERLGSSRSVVVITHSEALVSSIRATQLRL
jgi:DNA repair exonuclease SbcCD ATPase subunit